MTRDYFFFFFFFAATDFRFLKFFSSSACRLGRATSSTFLLDIFKRTTRRAVPDSRNHSLSQSLVDRRPIFLVSKRGRSPTNAESSIGNRGGSRFRGDRNSGARSFKLEVVASFLEASRPRFLKIPARTRSTSFFIPPAQKRERETKGRRVRTGFERRQFFFRKRKQVCVHLAARGENEGS